MRSVSAGRSQGAALPFASFSSMLQTCSRLRNGDGIWQRTCEDVLSFSLSPLKYRVAFQTESEGRLSPPRSHAASSQPVRLEIFVAHSVNASTVTWHHSWRLGVAPPPAAVRPLGRMGPDLRSPVRASSQPAGALKCPAHAALAAWTLLLVVSASLPSAAAVQCTVFTPGGCWYASARPDTESEPIVRPRCAFRCTCSPATISCSV